MHRSVWILVTILVLVGLVWVGQGLGVLEGSSFMVGDPLWAVAGTVLIAVGVGIGVIAISRRRE